MARAALHPALRRLGIGLPALVTFAALAASAPRGARAETEPDLRASLSCERASEPGRVRCTVEARAAERRTLAWADVQVLEVPDLASPLKGRIGPDEATTRQAASATWAFALVARKVGQGEARVRVRAVTCAREPGDAGITPSRCSPTTVEVRAVVVVG